MVAGAVAGIGEHVAMYPVDTIKTRMQALAHPGQQVRGAQGRRVKLEGFCEQHRVVMKLCFSHLL